MVFELLATYVRKSKAFNLYLSNGEIDYCQFGISRYPQQWRRWQFELIVDNQDSIEKQLG